MTHPLFSFCVVLRHAARHAEGRGYGREDRDGGLNDEAPYLSFLFIHDFSFRLRV